MEEPEGMTVAEFIRHLQDHFLDPDRDVITDFSVTGRNYSEKHGRHICTTKTEGPMKQTKE